MPRLPYADDVHRALSQEARSDRGYRRTQAHDARRGAERKDVNARAQVLLWGAQRASAAVLAVCVLVHLVTVIYAVRNGLSAAEILGRTAGSAGWAVFYGVFVGAVAVHAPIGLR